MKTKFVEMIKRLDKNQSDRLRSIDSAKAELEEDHSSPKNGAAQGFEKTKKFLKKVLDKREKL